MYALAASATISFNFYTVFGAHAIIATLCPNLFVCFYSWSRLLHLWIDWYRVIKLASKQLVGNMVVGNILVVLLNHA